MTRRTPLVVWVASAALGAAAALLAAAIGILGFFFVLLIIPGISGRTWLAATSGALTGFGATSLLLLGGPAGGGGAGDDGTVWMLVGVVPLVVGLALGALAVLAARRERT